MTYIRFSYVYKSAVGFLWSNSCFRAPRGRGRSLDNSPVERQKSRPSSQLDSLFLQRLTMVLLHSLFLVLFVSTLLDPTNASPAAATITLPHRAEALQEGPIDYPGMMCPTRLAGSVEVTIGGHKMMVPHVECITCNASCGAGGRGRCVQVVDNSSGQAWKRGCQCQVPVAEGSRQIYQEE